MTLEKQIKQVAAKWALIKLKSSDFLEFMSEKEFSSTDSYNHSIEKVTQILLDMHNSLKYIYEHELQNEATIIPIISEITTTSRELNNLKYKFLDKLSKLKTAKPSNDSETSSEDSEPKNIHINLPKIELEKFNGVYTRYPAFKHQFDAAIDSNNSLSQCQKLQYLKSFLTEEPLNLIRHLDLTNQNYQVAIELLESKYYKYRKIVFDLIDKLLNLKNITSPNSRFYQSLTSTVRQTIAQLKNLSINTDQWNPILVRLVSSKLDAKVHQDWLLTLENHDEIPSLDTLLIFIERQADSYLDSHSFNATKQKVQFKESNSARSLNVQVSNKDLSCKLCLKQHGLWQCEKFKKLSLEERSKFVNQNKLCKKCFSPSHYVNDCKRFNCRCGFKLSPLLHFCSNSKTNSSLKSEGGVVQKDPEDKKAGEQTGTKSSSKTSGHCGVDGSTTLLSRALIKTQDISGREVHIRAFIDTGSEISLISEEIVNQLGLEKQNALLNVKGLKGQHVTSSKGLVNLKIGSIIDDSYELDAPFYVVNSLNLTIPSVPLKRSQFKFISGLPLSDGTFNTPHTTGVLIGADLFSKLMLNDIRKSQDQNLVAQNTSLGWIVFGKAEALYKNDFNFNNKNAHAATTLEEINSNVLKLMDLDSTPDHAADSISNAELQFQFSIKENGSGQLQVALPFKIDPPILGDSLHKALTMLKRQEVKLNSNPLLKEEYFQYFDTLKELNFIELVGPLTMHDKTKNNQQFYLPHFGVYKGENSPLRIVLNGSAKSSSKYSLNDCLEVGDTLQNDIRLVLTRFRTYKFVVTTDIVKMYLQILIDPDHRNYLRILWKDMQEDVINIYRFSCLPFGLAPAAYLAIRCLIWLAEKNSAEYPQIESIIKKNTYLDDFLIGSDSPQNLLTLIKDLNYVLGKGHFKLDKWVSNSPLILDLLQKENILTAQSKFIPFGDHSTVLGLVWFSDSDQFSFNFTSFSNENLTKRNILSDLAKIYDPLGWISPCIITFKIIFQSLWKAGLNWDDPVPHAYQELWSNFRKEMTQISNFRIQRYLFKNTLSKFKLFGYADSSELAYGAVIYLVEYDSQNNYIDSNLIYAKFKVAPLKSLTIPRLELTAALTLVNSIKFILRAFEIKLEFIYLLSDSTVVLNWISSPPYKFKTFVSNRITEIQSLDFPHSWSHVPTAENPADLGTRGISVENFLNTEFWKKGYKAHFLSNPTPFKFLNEVKTPEEENKKEVVSFVHSLLKKEEVIDKYLSQFSSLERLVSHLSILKKFCIYLKIKREYPDEYKEKFKNFKTIRPLDRENSLLNLIKYSQISFVTEITSLENQEPLDRKSNILTLNPFLDKFHLLRVGGRLEEANIPYNQKHPLIISKSCYITKLLVRSYHLKYLHAGPNVISALLRLKFWIVQGRKLIRKVCRECITCFKQKPLTYTPLMGNLPGDRVNPSRPFENTGVDFFGPFMVHLNLRRGSKPQKVYVSTFVCFATKACHFEVCTDLSTECFLNALKRFIARRGVPKRIYSDNGTTFVSASKVVRSELNQLISKMKNNEVMKFLSENSICWSFVPTYSPHFGGLWESSVRVCKQYLKRIVGQSFLTLLELETLLCQVESILNSRPLTPLSDDSESLEYLSPGHFLVGQPLVQLPVLEHCQERNCKLNQRFKFLENLKAGFWKAWSNNYLNTLQQRYKGKTKIVNLVVNQLVLIQDKNTLTNQWKLGRVLEVFPGKDGTVRVVKLKTQLGTITRPVVKLAPLPIEI